MRWLDERSAGGGRDRGAGERMDAVRAADHFATALGRGLLAGAAATVAMTVSSTVEMRLRGRAPSGVPADVAGRLLGVQPHPEHRDRFGMLAHAVAGVSLGVTRGLLDLAGVRGPRASLPFFAIAWAPDLILAPVAGAASPPWRWGATELSLSALHHAVYAVAGDHAFRALRDPHTAAPTARRGRS